MWRVADSPVCHNTLIRSWLSDQSRSRSCCRTCNSQSEMGTELTNKKEAYFEHVDPEHMEQGGVGLLLELRGDGGDVGGAGLKNFDQ